jgi:hypothetical protein
MTPCPVIARRPLAPKQSKVSTGTDSSMGLSPSELASLANANESRPLAYGAMWGRGFATRAASVPAHVDVLSRDGRRSFDAAPDI